MTELAPIIQLGNPLLRRKAARVENIQDQQIQKLINDLMTTVNKSNGVGIAAPQIAESLRLFIVASRPNPRYPDAPEMQAIAMINPQIIGHSTEVVKGWEGCLSVPGIRGLVPRYQRVEVEYADSSGRQQKQELTNFIARIFQHEYDHLEGLVFLDRVKSTEDLMTEEEYQKQIVKSSEASSNSSC